MPIFDFDIGPLGGGGATGNSWFSGVGSGPRRRLARLRKGKTVRIRSAYRLLAEDARFTGGRLTVTADRMRWVPYKRDSRERMARDLSPDTVALNGVDSMPECEPWEPWEVWESYDVAEFRSSQGDFALAMDPLLLDEVLHKLRLSRPTSRRTAEGDS